MNNLAQVEMLRTIEQEAAMTGTLTGRSLLSPRVMKAMGEVPREQFVPAKLSRDAYGNFPLPIGSGQTISQPFIVALMTDLLETRPSDKVLEVGTGSGYQAAVLAKLVDRVYSLELLPELASAAQRLLLQLGYRNIAVRNADGYQGWQEHAPYDAIIVTAAAPEVPRRLTEQLKDGGRLVIPVGAPYQRQELLRLEKDTDGRIRREEILAVAFVPLVHGH